MQVMAFIAAKEQDCRDDIILPSALWGSLCRVDSPSIIKIHMNRTIYKGRKRGVRMKE
ncbi:MAG: hypothetical protein ACI35R_15540 [Bacillus sp. (in: firmicutes)]